MWRRGPAVAGLLSPRPSRVHTAAWGPVRPAPASSPREIRPVQQNLSASFKLAPASETRKMKSLLQVYLSYKHFMRIRNHAQKHLKDIRLHSDLVYIVVFQKMFRSRGVPLEADSRCDSHGMRASRSRGKTLKVYCTATAYNVSVTLESVGSGQFLKPQNAL